jgi:hypothetical protein
MPFHYGVNDWRKNQLRIQDMKAPQLERYLGKLSPTFRSVVIRMADAKLVGINGRGKAELLIKFKDGMNVTPIIQKSQVDKVLNDGIFHRVGDELWPTDFGKKVIEFIRQDLKDVPA